MGNLGGVGARGPRAPLLSWMFQKYFEGNTTETGISYGRYANQARDLIYFLLLVGQVISDSLGNN